MGMPDDFNRVGKYDALMVWEQIGTGNRWSVELKEWVDPDTRQFTSWIDEEDRPELNIWLRNHPNELPHDGHWVNINEA
jgi:hypothetical protein